MSRPDTVSTEKSESGGRFATVRWTVVRVAREAGQADIDFPMTPMEPRQNLKYGRRTIDSSASIVQRCCHSLR